MENIQRLFSYVLRIIAVLFIAFILVLIVYRIKKYWPAFHRQKAKNGSRLHSGLIPETGNAEDSFKKAEEYYRQGNLREAWAACFFGYIWAYKQHFSILFPPDATEYGCLAVLRKLLPDETERFNEMLQSCIPFAYGGKLPVQGAFEKAIISGRSIKARIPGDPNEPQ